MMASMMVLVLSSYELVLLTFISSASLKIAIASPASFAVFYHKGLNPQDDTHHSDSSPPVCLTPDRKGAFHFQASFFLPCVLHTTMPCALFFSSAAFHITDIHTVFFYFPKCCSSSPPGLLQWCALPAHDLTLNLSAH